MCAETNYLSSDLSNPKYSYDLVVGTTAQAINATLKLYLYKSPPPTKVIWYGQAAAGGPVTPMTPIPGIDPFSIPQGGTPPQALLDSDFAFAIQAGFGLPPGVSPLSVPDILILGSNSQRVGYNMFFSTFQICTLDWGRGGSYAWNNYTQPSGTPWIFSYQVDMNFNAADPNASFSGLPAGVQQQLLNYNTNTMFSVQQLYMDLNNAGLQSMPQISGIPSTSQVYVVLQSDFINTYWQSIAAQGQFVLGYAVSSTQASSPASVTPTALNFIVSPHYDANGNIDANTTLYTLNYLMSTANRPLSVGGAFPWNWVDSAETNSYHGAMAVRRQVFADYLNAAIGPYLSYIAVNPYSHITISNAGFSWSANSSLSPSSGQSLTYSPAPGPLILNYTYSKASTSSDKSGLISGHYNLLATASGTVQVTGTTITITVASNLDIDFSNGDIFGVGDVSGRVGGFSSTLVLEVAVNAAGQLTVTPQAGSPTTNMIGPDLHSGVMSGIDGVDNLTGSLTGIYTNMQNFMNSFSSQVADYLNSAGGRWVFPGGQTFVFKDAAFSQFQDFVTHITYADPSV